MMNRRELLRAICIASGASLIGGEVLAFQSAPPATAIEDTPFSAGDQTFLDEVGEAIIPATETPGARDAAVGAFMIAIVSDCYSPEERSRFLAGMGEIRRRARVEKGQDFMQLSTAGRGALIAMLDAEARDHNAGLIDYSQESIGPGRWQGLPAPSEPWHYFTPFKQLTLLGFFTSKAGATEALRYVAVPGRYDGDAPYQKGDRAWATS